MFELPPAEESALGNLSLESIAKIIFTIRAQAHPLRQLEVAELKINTIMEALEHNWLKSRKRERSLLLKQQQISELESKPELTLLESIRLNNYQDELVVATRSFGRLQALVRDAQTELAVISQEKERILAQNPEFRELTYLEIQQRYSHAVFSASLAKTIAVKNLAAQTLIPEEVVSIFADLSDGDTSTSVLEQSKEVAQRIIERINPCLQESLDLSHLSGEEMDELKKLLAKQEDKNGTGR
jgi:hypothetical protein